MARKSNRIIAGVAASAVSFFTETVLPLVSLRLNQTADALFDRVETRTAVIQKRVVRTASAFLLFSIGSLFLILAAYYFLVTFLNVDKWIVFFSLGALLLLLGFMVRYKAYEVRTA